MVDRIRGRKPIRRAARRLALAGMAVLATVAPAAAQTSAVRRAQCSASALGAAPHR